jgi:RNA polymerase sigma factor (sigma-70 family)
MNTAKLDGIRQGDPEIMISLLEAVYPVIKYTASRFNVDPRVTLQEVSIHLLRDPVRTARLAEEGTLRNWCRVLSRNSAIHQLQRAHKERLPDVSTDEPFVEPANPEQEFENAERTEHIRRLLSSLDEVDQKIIILRYVEEVAFDEIATRLSLEADNVRKRANRAMAKLRYRVRGRIER